MKHEVFILGQTIDQKAKRDSTEVTFLASLLQCIGQNFYMNYIQIVVFLYIILRVTFFCVCQLLVVIIVHTLLYLTVFCTFKFSSMTLFLSLSPSCALDIVP